MRHFAAWSSSSFKHILLEKDIRIEGTERLGRLDIERLLPLNRSVIWWMTNYSTIESRLRENPAIGSVKVSPCGQSALNNWGCFVVDVGERKSHYIGILKDGAWLIGEDGGFMRPLGRDEIVDPGWIPVTGLSEDNQSPDVIHQIFSALRQSESILAETYKKPISSIHVEGNSEFKAKFKGQKFEARFELPRGDGSNTREQGIRLNELVTKMGNKIDSVASVDLAYNRVAVVKIAE